MKILVVEDDRSVAQSLQLLLSSYNYAVDIATDGKTGMQMADAYQYDLLLLDVILPDLNGVNLCQQLRIKGLKTPILLLTGQGGGHQKAIALNAGADDYVVKPFDTEELIARIQALMRRGGVTNSPILSWGNLSIDPSSRQVAYGTHLLSVTPKEYAILELFLRNPHRPFNAKMILDQVWTSLESPGEEAVRVHIKELRQKLTASGAPKDFIKTKHRVGYQLNPLYASSLGPELEDELTAPQIAELKAVNDELRVTLEQLRSTQTALCQKNQELEAAYQTIEQERQRLQISRDELKIRVAERTAQLVNVDYSLQQQQDQWRALFEHAMDAIAIADDNGYYLEANPAACELFGVSRETMLRSGVADFADPELDVTAVWQEFLRLGHISGEFRLFRPDGTIRDTEFAAIANFIPGRHLSILRDITERKQAELAFKRSEERFRHLAENSNAVIWFADSISLDNLYVSPAYESIWGRSRQSLVDHPDSWLEAIHPEDRDRIQIKLEQQRLGKASDVEYRIVKPDGSIRWIWDQGFAIRNEAGQVYLYGGIAEDITKRKQAELELRQREAFLSSIYDGADQAIFVIDVTENNDFLYVGFNAKAEQYGQVRSHAIQGKTPEAAFGVAVGSLFRQNYQRCLEAGTSISYEEHVLIDSQPIWTLTTLSPLRNEYGQINRIVGTAIDITERKHLEISLQESEVKLSGILDSAIAAIVRFRVYANHDWEYEYWSAGCERVYGYPLKMYQDKNFWMTQVIPDDLEQILMPLFNNFFLEQEAVAEYRFRHGDGSIRWLSSSYTSRKVSEDCWVITSINYDITERKHAEEALRESEQLYHQILDSIADIVVVKQPDSRLLWGNKAFREYYGMTLEELQGLIDAPFNEPDYTRQYIQDDEFVFNTGQTLTISEEAITRHDGVVRTFNTIKAPIYNEAGQIVLLVAVCRDISDRKQLELSLQASETKLSQILNRVSAAIVQFRVFSNHDWEYDYFSTGCEVLFGYTAQELMADKMLWMSRVVPDDRDTVLLPMLNVLVVIGVSPNIEYRFYHKDGSIRWISSTYTSQQIEPNCWQVTTVSQDITDRKLAIADLEQSERKLRAVFDSTYAFMGLLTPSGIVIDANRAALTVVACELSDVVGVPFWETPWWAHFPEQQQYLKQVIQRAADGEFVRCETKHIWTDQIVRFVDFSLRPVFDEAGSVVMLIPEGRDITDSKLAEQKIREQAALLDITSDAILVSDLSHHILYWNQGAEQLYGWQVAEVMGQLTYELLQENVAQVTEMSQLLLREGEWRGEIRQVTKTGKEVFVEARWTLVRDEAGQPKFILSVNTDVTEKKQLEAQFYRAQRLESMGTLAGGIAHDLNNVLTPILTISQLLRLKQANLDSRSQEMLQLLEDSAKRGANMVKQILTFTRGTGGDRVPLQVAPLLQEIATVVQQTFPKTISIHQEIAGSSLWVVSADPTQLQQVFMNLCVNARDAMPQGGSLTIRADNCSVDKTFAQRNLDAHVGNYVLVTITDTGVGIPPEIRDRIFEPFFTTKQPGRGTGLGLSTVLGIVKSYGGFIQVSSQLEQGTEVKVYLPAVEANPLPVEAPEELLHGTGELVLIVDDDFAVQQTNQSLLESYNYRTLTANDGTEGLAVYVKHQPEIDIVLMDIMMPNMDGISAVRALCKINPQVKVVAISGLANHKEAVLKAGASAFLAKPYSMKELLSVIHMLGPKSKST